METYQNASRRSSVIPNQAETNLFGYAGSSKKAGVKQAEAKGQHQSFNKTEKVVQWKINLTNNDGQMGF